MISFIVSLFFIFLFYRKIYFNPLKNKIINKIINKSYHFDTSNLHFIEDELKSLPPNDSYKGPVFPDDGKITKEWVLNLIEFMKDLENKKSLEEKYLDKTNLLKLLLKGKQVLNEFREALIDVDILKEKISQLQEIYMDNSMIYYIFFCFNSYKVNLSSLNNPSCITNTSSFKICTKGKNLNNS